MGGIGAGIMYRVMNMKEGSNEDGHPAVSFQPIQDTGFANNQPEEENEM